MFEHISVFNRSELNQSMNFDDLVTPQIQPMDDPSMENSMSIGDLMNQNSMGSSSLVASGAAEEPLPAPVAEGFFGGLFDRVKSMVQKQNDDLNTNIDISQRSMGESGLNNSSTLQMSAGQQSSSQVVGGGFFMPQDSAKK